ncbi:WxL domain-containing protein [Lactiplantibacillus pentosus]
MKKVVGSLLMTSTMLLGALAPIVANAADGENRSGTTDTTATFTANTTNPVDPVDPTDPTKPLNPGDGDNGASAGATFTGATSGVVLTAADKNGAGITSDLLDPTAIKLNVVANTASATTYKGVLNWTLTSSADN